MEIRSLDHSVASVALMTSPPDATTTTTTSTNHHRNALLPPRPNANTNATSGFIAVASNSRPTREGVLQRLSEALLRRSLVKVRERIVHHVELLQVLR